jgi:hypothetical protein
MCGAGIGGARLLIRTSGRVRGSGTGLLGYGGALQGECEEQESVSPDWGDALRAECSQQALDVPGYGCALKEELRGAGTGHPGLGRRTGYTGPWRLTGDLERRAGITRSGWMLNLARLMQGAGTDRTGL